ncbi:MAG: molybdenum cofactor guanylyltransferase [Candidatus Eremiobacteraeota bacterium]|nr:molybdenum cofactor guanylyltransferase [Candidatus Eremiobacteraeota bacterium]
MPDDIAIVILAGGRATRFPGKLEWTVDGDPMLLHVYRKARATQWPVVVAARGSFGATIDAALDCPISIDRWPGKGPLAGLASACERIEQERVFALAADMPKVEPFVVSAIVQAWQPGDEAVVPSHRDGIEPLAALYARAALARETPALLAQPHASMHDLIDRLRARFVPLDQQYFLNVNSPEDVALLGETRA